MSTQDTSSSRPVVWFEGVGQDADKLRAFYVEVPDIEKAIERAQALGSRVLMPITKLPDTTIALISDPEGRPIGLSTPA